jgi:putative transposase
MGILKQYYQRNLPHYHPPDSMLFVTFRLANSLPNETIIRLKEERELLERKLKRERSAVQLDGQLYKLRKRYFGKFDKLLDDMTSGPHWLSDNRVATSVADSISYRDGKQYELLAYTIMPNHVHMVVTVERSATSFYRVLQSLKAYTAKEANKILNLHGAFWQHESYDHVVRNEKELGNIIWYVLHNPLKAGLVKDWKEWKWSYCKYDV